MVIEYVVLALFDKKETKNYPFLKTSFLCIIAYMGGYCQMSQLM